MMKFEVPFHASHGVCWGDTSPLGGLLRGNVKLSPGNWLKTETMTGKARRKARFQGAGLVPHVSPK